MKMRPFELILIGIFGVSAIAGLFIFANYKSDDGDPRKFGSSVTIWGTFDETLFSHFLIKLQETEESVKVIHYRQIDERQFDHELLNAIADGTAPDLVIIPNSLLVRYRSKLYPISYKSITQEMFKTSYIDGAEIFMLGDGIYGIPLAVDPLMLYWNRDLFSQSGLSTAPKTWETIQSQYLKALNKKDDWQTISVSAIGLGQYSNVVHAKKIFSMLMYQLGSPIVSEDSFTKYKVSLTRLEGQSQSLGDQALSFYTQFTLPNKEAYSWNRSKGFDRDEFLHGKLAMYFGMGSERKLIENGNPNLNFDVAIVPQGSEGSVQRTYADIYAFAIPKISKNIQGGYSVALYLTSSEIEKQFLDVFDLAPANRQLHTEQYNDSYKNVEYKSALIARGWLDPNPEKTEYIFQDMIERYLINQKDDTAVFDAEKGIGYLFK